MINQSFWHWNQNIPQSQGNIIQQAKFDLLYG